MFSKADSILVVNGHQAGKSGTIAAAYDRQKVSPAAFLVDDVQGGQFVETAENMAVQGRPAGASGPGPWGIK